MNERRIIECQRKRCANLRNAGEKILVLIRKPHTFFLSLVTKANTVSAGNKSDCDLFRGGHYGQECMATCVTVFASTVLSALNI